MDQNIVPDTTTATPRDVPLGDTTGPANTQARAAVATTQKNTVLHDVFQNKHMYVAEFVQWAVSDPVGTVLRILKNHPDNHVFAAILAPHHLYWSGTMRDHFLMCGTALYGGKLRVAKVPPHIHDADIYKMSISDLSRFPGVDMDPKQFPEMSIEYDDINDKMFHVYSKDQDNPSAIGGKLVVFVLGKLQATLQDAEPISIIVQRSLEHKMDLYHFVPKTDKSFTTTPVFDRMDLPTQFGGKYASLKINAQSVRVRRQSSTRYSPSVSPKYIQPVPKVFYVPAILANHEADVEGFHFRRSSAGDDDFTIYVKVKDLENGLGRMYIQDPAAEVDGFVYRVVINVSAAKEEYRGEFGAGTKGRVAQWSPYRDEWEGPEVRPVNSERFLTFIGTDTPQVAAEEEISGALNAPFFEFYRENFTPLNADEVIMFEILDQASNLLTYAKLHQDGHWTVPPGADGDGEIIIPAAVRFRYLQRGRNTMNFPSSASNTMALWHAAEVHYLKNKSKRRALRAMIGKSDE